MLIRHICLPTYRTQYIIYLRVKYIFSKCKLALLFASFIVMPYKIFVSKFKDNCPLKVWNDYIQNRRGVTKKIRTTYTNIID